MVWMKISMTSRSRIPAMSRALRDEMQEIVDDAAESTLHQIQLAMLAAGGGHVYMRGGLPHEASAPGTPPAIWTGELFRSLGISRIGSYSAQVSATAPHARFLEYGTSKMAPRPFMRPAGRRTSRLVNLTAPIKIASRMASAPWS